VIDSHCHLADEAFAPDLDAVVGRAKAAGLERALVILDAGNAKESSQAARVEALWPDVRVAIGIHPHHANLYSDEPERGTRLVRAQLAATASARAIGEIGLDYHYDFSTPEVQRAVLRAQLRLARELNRPVVVHSREADEDMLTILRREPAGEVRGVFHCFSGTAALAAAALELGFYISLSGIVTFPKADDLRKIARDIPLDRLLIETDSPFLAPVPFRGKRNEPAHVVQVAEKLAGIYGLPPAELAARTTANFHALFAP
jgi:TatD DNase family protein